jgi:hypothetical protein
MTTSNAEHPVGWIVQVPFYSGLDELHPRNPHCSGWIVQMLSTKVGACVKTRAFGE